MRKWLCALILVALNACASLPPALSVPASEKEANQITQNFYRFLDLAKYDYSQTEPVDVSFVRGGYVSEKHFVAACLHWANLIQIDLDKWENLRSFEKEIVMFHELGHCILKRPHVDREVCVPQREIMCPTLFNIKRSYRKYREEYIRKFFNLDENVTDEEIEEISF